jgi:Family of unknown function (DUF5330)
MWFILRMTFWLCVVLVLLPNSGSHTMPKAQVSAGEAFSSAKDVMIDFEHFCERQEEACVVGSRTAVTLAASVRKQAQKCSTSFSVGVSDRTSPKLRTRSPFLSADRICELLASEPA